MATALAVIEGRFGKSATAVLRLAAAAGRLLPLTPLGACVVSLLLLAAWLQRGQHPDLIVQILYLGGLGLVLLGFVLVLATMGWLLLAGMPAAENALVLEVGTPLRTGLRLGWPSRNPLVRIGVSWQEFTAVRVEMLRARGGLEEQATAAARDYRDSILRRFTVTDVLGLTRLAVSRRFLQVVRCLPTISAAPQFTLPLQNEPGDQMGHPEGQPVGDVVEMRRYVPGDPLKLVLWRAYARTGKVLVRAPERAVSPTTRTLAYLIAGPGDEPSAGIARTALLARALGNDVTFSADGAPHPAANLSEAVDQILFSARQGDEGGLDLDRFLGQGESAGTAACVLFLPCRQGAWVGHTVAALRAHLGPFRAVMGLEGPSMAESPQPWWRRALLRPLDGSRPQRAEIRAIRRAFREAGCEVAVFQRDSGNVDRSDEDQ